MSYGCVLTEAGQAQIANALALGQQISLTQMAVGDGGGEVVTPDATMTALVGEKYKADVNRLAIDPSDPGHVIVELVIPSSQGGWTIREVGLFDVDGNLVAVGNTPESYKPTGAEGSLVEQTIRAHLRMTEASAGVLQLKIDPTIVLSTRQYVDEEVATRAPMDHGHPEKADVDHDHQTEEIEDLLPNPHQWAKGQRYAQTALAIEVGAVAWNMEANPHAVLPLTSNVTSFAMSNYKAGATYELTILQNETGNKSCVWPSVVRWPGGTVLDVTQAPNSEDLVNFSVRDADGTPVLRAFAGQDFKAVS